MTKPATVVRSEGEGMTGSEGRQTRHSFKRKLPYDCTRNTVDGRVSNTTVQRPKMADDVAVVRAGDQAGFWSFGIVLNDILHAAFDKHKKVTNIMVTLPNQNFFPLKNAAPARLEQLSDLLIV